MSENTSGATSAGTDNFSHEKELDDNYTININHWYVVEGNPTMFTDEKLVSTVGLMKKAHKLTSIKNCDTTARGIPLPKRDA